MAGETTSSSLCSTCSTYFPSSTIRREHMRSDWHVYNMKRRITELPPIPLSVYDNMIREQATRCKKTATETDASRKVSAPVSLDQKECSISDSSELCLFCYEASDTLEANMGHMATKHGFRVRDQAALQTDLHTFLAYISMVIQNFNACIYCGQEKATAEATQSHMIDKGHCMLDLSPDSEFLDFWGDDESPANTEAVDTTAAATMLSLNEMRLPSGSVASSRNDGRPGVKQPRSRAPRTPGDEVALLSEPSQEHRRPESASQPATTRSVTNAVAIRDQMGIVGLSDPQRRALAIVQQKAMSREQRTRSEGRWVLEKFNNKTKQKHFKPDVPGRKNG